MAATPIDAPPEVSVIMPAWNSEKTIAASIRSVLAQTYTNFELVIIDDCSDDATGKLAAEFITGEPRVRIHRLDKNRGRAFARNFGVSVAEGKWIAFLDSDDLWRQDKLLKQMAFMQDSQAGISYTASAFIDADGRPYRYVMPAKHRLTYRELLRRNLMSLSSVIVRKDLMARVKMPEIPGGMIHEDYSAWLRIVKETGCAYGLDEPLLIYRLSKDSASGKRLKSARMVFNTYKNVGYRVVSAFLLTARYSLHSIGKRMWIHIGGYSS